VGMTVDDRGTLFAFFNWRFDRLFSGGNKAAVDTNERR